MRCLCAIVSCWFAFSAVAQDSAPSAAEQPATPSAQQQPAATPESTPAISTPGAPASPAPQVQGRKRAETDV
ncbi:MAG TPA: hypothetical protein VEQ63_10645, partial [Bryobacteraceae bacterium]|nr:hypothetical protein [Bryobacteraceae bacterium]